MTTTLCLEKGIVNLFRMTVVLKNGAKKQCPSEDEQQYKEVVYND